MRYFDQTQYGLSKWWSWIVVTWLALLGWVIGQTVLIGMFLVPVAKHQDDEIASDFDKAVSVVPPEFMESYQASSAVLLLGALLSAIFAVALVLRDRSVTTASETREVFSNPGGDNATANRGRLVLLILTLATIVITIVAYRYNSSLIDGSDYMAVMNRAMGVSPLTFGLFLLTFPAGLGFLYLGQKFIHRRSLRSLHTAAARVRWTWIIQGFLVTWLVLGGLSLLGNALGFMAFEFAFDPSRFWGFALVSLLLIPLQSGTEEIVFRGYFNQALTHISGNKWIAFTLTSLAFMAMHLSNPEALAVAPGILPIVMSGYFVFGFAACLLVLFDDGLETAIGVHAGNNCFAAILVNYENSVLPTPSVFVTGQDPLKDAIATIVVFAVIVLIFRTLRRRSNTRA